MTEACVPKACVRFRQRYLARMSSKDIVVMIVVDEMGNNHPGDHKRRMTGVKGQIRQVRGGAPVDRLRRCVPPPPPLSPLNCGGDALTSHAPQH